MRHISMMASAGLALALIGLAIAKAPPPPPPAFPPIAPNQGKLEQTLIGLDSPGLAIAYGEESGILVASGDNGTLAIWSKEMLVSPPPTTPPKPNLLKAHAGPATGIAWHGGPALISAGADRKILLWSMPAGTLTHTIPVGSIVRALTLSPDGKLAAAATDDNAIQLVDVSAGKPGAKLVGHTDWARALAFSNDGKMLASAGNDGNVILWEMPAGKKIRDFPSKPLPAAKTPAIPNNIVQSLAFSPDGKLLAIGGDDVSIHLCNPTDGKIVRSLPGHTGPVTALAFHPTGTLLVSGSKDRTVRLWNPIAGQPLKSLEGHTAWVEGVVFLNQGTRIASASADQTVRIWDLKEPKKK